MNLQDANFHLLNEDSNSDAEGLHDNVRDSSTDFSDFSTSTTTGHWHGCGKGMSLSIREYMDIPSTNILAP